MGMTRTQAISYLNNRYSAYQLEAAVTPDDTASGYKDVVDDSLLKLGTAYEDLDTAEVASEFVLPYRALLRYYGLKLFDDRLGTRLSYNVSGTGVDEKLGALVAQVRTAIAMATAGLRTLGYPVEGTDEGASIHTLRLGIDGIYEPSSQEM